MAASSDYPEVMKATSLDNSQVHSFLFLVTKSYTLFMNVILCLCCWHFSWHLLTDMAVMFTNINHYFKWGLVNMLTWQSSANMLTYIYSCFEKGCRKKRTRQSQKVLWVVLSALFSKEFWKNGTRGHGHTFASANRKQQK